MPDGTATDPSCLLFAHHALVVEAGLQVFVTGQSNTLVQGSRRLRDEDVSIYVFPPGNCYFLGVRENLIIEIPEETFDHLASTGTIFVCTDEPGAYLLTHALTLHLPTEKLLEAKGAYAAHRSSADLGRISHSSE